MSSTRAGLWIRLAFCGLLVLGGLAGARDVRAQGEIDVLIDRGSADPYRVAVQRFDADIGSRPHVEDFYRELTEAVDFNAGFLAMDSSAFLDSAVTENFDRVSINCENWRGIGANVLVQGLLQEGDGRQRAQYRVWDIDRCTLQGDSGLLDAETDARWLIARRLADDVIYRFTNVRGVAATQLAFISDESGNKELYIAESDGSRKRKITRNGRINLFPDWSSTGAELAYTTFTGSRPDLRVVRRGDRPGGDLLESVPGKYRESERVRGVFGPDDSWATVIMDYESNVDIYLMRRDGGEMRQLTNDRSIEVSPSWSPDGKQLAFASDRSGSQQIYVMDLESGFTRRVTYRGNYNATPSWSPTGEWIAYAARTGNTLDIYLVDPESGYTVPLVVHPRTDESPSWSPDGRKIAFSSDRRGRREVYTIDIDGRNLRRATQDFGNSSSPAWSTWLE